MLAADAAAERAAQASAIAFLLGEADEAVGPPQAGGDGGADDGRGSARGDGVNDDGTIA